MRSCFRRSSAFLGVGGRPTTPTPTSRNLFRENVDSESFEKLFFPVPKNSCILELRARLKLKSRSEQWFVGGLNWMRGGEVKIGLKIWSTVQLMTSCVVRFLLLVRQ